MRKRFNRSNFTQAVYSGAEMLGMIIVILIGAFLLNFFLARSTIPFVLADFVSSLPLSPLAIMGVIMLIYLILGCFIDGVAMVLLTIPIFLPLALALGFDVIWFGIILCRAMEISVITPPVGMNVYAIAGVVKDVPMSTIFKGIVPFLIADVFNVILLLFVPQIVLFLPGLMK
ncbi:TRAP transporter large permease subunit [Chloroflexota bacterium]